MRNRSALVPPFVPVTHSAYRLTVVPQQIGRKRPASDDLRALVLPTGQLKAPIDRHFWWGTGCDGCGEGVCMSAAVDRIDILDESGRSIGWVDPATGIRNLLDPGHKREFNEMVDFWMTTAGVEEPESAPTTLTERMSVSEVRFPDPPVIRSLLVPLRPLT